MSDPIPSAAIYDATAGGRSVIVITGGSTGDVLTLQEDGSYAAETPAGASPGGSSGQMQFNNAGAFGGATAVIYAGSGTHVTVTAQNSTAIPLCVKGAASQTGNLFEARDAAGNAIVTLPATRGLSLFDQFVDVHALEYSSRALCLRQSFAGNKTAMAWFSGQTAVNGSGSGMLICTDSPGYGHFVDIAPTMGVVFASLNAIPTTIPTTNGGSKFRIPNNTAARTDTLVVSGGTVVGFGNERHDGISVTIVGSNGHISGTAAAANGGNVIVACGASAGTGTPGRFEVRTLAGSLRLQVDGNTTAGETPLLLLDIDKGTLQRVSIGAADSGGTGFKVLRVPN